MEIKTDDYGEVINHTQTYKVIADTLTGGQSIIVGWSDGHGTHLDVLFTLRPVQFGHLQRGLKARTDLFVSVMSHAAFAFEAIESNTNEGYIDEKLNGLGTPTATAMAKLINGIRKNL